MTVLAALAGFFLYLSLENFWPRSAGRGRENSFRDSGCFKLALAVLALVSSVTIIFASAVYQAGNDEGGFRLLYSVGRELSRPWVNISVIFFVIGGWVAVHRHDILNFLKKKL
ncbi:hypothetical protein RUR49_17070 [Pseudoxanthobacter sp. M-2]|uniref:hypothetical protein n=1 Tax=Pseudoxanthobacter sp. M-2 TaxID=3078754 RepID=UPI0038FC9012